ncbi:MULTISPECIES: PilN domain-containing protein [Cyanophyceae]|uniref:PilN domain-containing protein n=1 Tax=Cyanophyceae TaxID=3028117 RepID=UPI0016879B3C|nr:MULTISPECIES: PilN domain-containing protein [Cyanophyceae]MBD1917067.1 PilN domain-containing protein [Phormidium sp. FACHB-77]MBD2030598.1 PilN domain-containing protein [Phormidium sp. FACHB-322]MBD2050294.1 PilN domain-containing protein [Leptolyngbya sp. FACHB-60]
MYGLDINFLKDREVRVFEARPRARGGGGVTPGDRRPLYLGLAAAVVPLALVGGYFFVTQGQVRQLRTRSAALDAETAQLQSQLQEISGLQGQIDLVRSEINAFVTVFNEILPWSALLQDIRTRTPARVQIVSLDQTTVTPEQTDPNVAPESSEGISINGVACSYDEINDFALVLQRSPLLQSQTVAISQAQQQPTLLDPQTQGRCPGTPVGDPDFLIDYTIGANITDTPASQLVDELERQGTVGLVTRLQALREKGVIE